MTTNLHRIKAYLYDNPLTDDPNDFKARTSSERSLNIRQICESAITRGGANIQASTMQYVTELFLKEMAYQLCDGYSVNTGYFTASPTIKGTFNNPAENFNPEKHRILFRFNEGNMLRKELSSIQVDILGVAESGLIITQVLDIKSNSINNHITPLRNLKITGKKLKIVGHHPDVGVFLINQENDEIVRIEPSDIVVNYPSELMIRIPDIPAGEYKLKVITQFSRATPLKKPRTTIFDKILTVI